MNSLVTIYFPNPSGIGWVDAGAGRISINSTRGLTEEVVCDGLQQFIWNYVRFHPQTPKPFDPTRVVVTATFGDLGQFWINGNGERQEKVVIG